MNHRRIWAWLVGIGMVTCIGILTSVWQSDPPVTRAQAHTDTKDARRVPRDFTKFSGISLEQSGQGGVARRARAGFARLEKRIGVGGLLVYEDARELKLASVAIDIEIPRDSTPSFSDIAQHVERLFIDSEHSVLDPHKRLSIGYEDGTSGAFLSRISFDQISIEFRSARQRRLLLTARSGRLNLDSRTLVLSGDVELVTSEGHQIGTGMLVLSNDLEGAYAPAGFERGGEVVSGRSSLVLGDDGWVDTQTRARRIEHADSLERFEKLLLTRYLDRVPASLKPLAGAILGGLR